MEQFQRTADRTVAEFADALRALKQRSGLTYEDMAHKAAYSRSALAKVVNGQRPTSWPLVRAYVTACGGDEDEWQARWLALAPPTAPAQRVPVAHPFPDPETLDSVERYVAALDELRVRAGLSYRQLSESTRVKGARIAPTTLFGLLHGDRLPPESMLITYLRACGVVHGAAVGAWRIALDRLASAEALRQMPCNGTGGGPTGLPPERSRWPSRLLDGPADPSPPVPDPVHVDRDRSLAWLAVVMLLLTLASLAVALNTQFR
jgi:transcriptional regulator with XRE-family HTH domain